MHKWMMGGATVAYAPEDGAGGAAAAAATTSNLWYSPLPADLQDYVQKNGLADKDPLAAFQAAAQSDIGLKAHMGVPASQLLKLPEGDNPDAWKAVWQRLGAPDSADKYDFTTIRGPNNADLDAPSQAQVEAARGIAAKLNLPQSMAVQLAQEMVQRNIDAGTAAAADRSAQVQAGMAALRQNWAQNFDANSFVAQQAMKAFGMTPEQIATVQGSPNVAAAMETWRQIGARIGEDKFVAGGGGGGNQNIPMTKGDATSRLDELKNDSEWRTRWNAGGAAERREFERLTQLAAGVDASGNTLG